MENAPEIPVSEEGLELEDGDLQKLKVAAEAVIPEADAELQTMLKDIPKASDGAQMEVKLAA